MQKAVTVSVHCGGERWCACAQTYLRDHRIVLVGSAQTLTASSMSASLYIVYQIRAAAPHGGAAETAPPPPPPSHLSLELGKVVRDLCAVLFLSDLSSHSSYMFSCAQLKITGMVGIYYCVVLLTSPRSTLCYHQFSDL